YTARLVEIGAESTNCMYGQWAICVNSNGTALQLVCQAEGMQTNVLDVPIDWPPSQWRHVVVTYSPSNSCLYIDGELKTTAGGVPCYPPACARAEQGLRVGTDHEVNCKIG